LQGVSLGISKNLKLCVMLHLRNVHLHVVNSVFISVVSLGFEIFRSVLLIPNSLNDC